jgi:phosphinothricin acetyltransferase
MSPESSISAACAVRDAEIRDLPAINEIYNEAVVSSIATFDTEPATVEEHEKWLQDRQRPYAVIVAERQGEVVGWAAIKSYVGKDGYRFTVENSVYVRADLRRNEIGALLLERLLERAGRNGFRSVIARIALPNPASERLHRRLGFRRVGVEKEVGYKFDRWVDVAVWQRLLAE